MWFPGRGFGPRRRQHVSADFNTVSGWPVFRMRRTLKPRSLEPEIVYRASQRSHGTLINPGIQVGCQWKLTWSYKQSTPHMYHTQSAGTQIGVTSLYALQDNKRNIRLQHASLHPSAFYILTSQPWPTIQSPAYHQPHWCIYIFIFPKNHQNMEYIASCPCTCKHHRRI